MVYTPRGLLEISSVGLAEERLAQLISSLESSRFPSMFVDWLRACVSCDNVAMIAYFQDRNPLILMSYSNHPSVHAKLETEYVDGAYLLDPFHELHVNKAPHGVYRLSEVAPDHFQRNQYYITYYRQTTLVDEIAFVSYPTEGVSIQICLGKDSNSGTRFSAKKIKYASRIAPIVASLAETHWSNLSTTGTYQDANLITHLVNAVRASLNVALTPRQAEVAMYILRGHSSLSIGLNLGISRQTVKVFRRQLYKRLNISSQAELFNLLLPLLSRY